MKIGMRVQDSDGRRGTVVDVDAQGFVNLAWDNETTSLEVAASLSLVGA